MYSDVTVPLEKEDWGGAQWARVVGADRLLYAPRTEMTEDLPDDSGIDAEP